MFYGATNDDWSVDQSGHSEANCRLRYANTPPKRPGLHELGCSATSLAEPSEGIAQLEHD